MLELWFSLYCDVISYFLIMIYFDIFCETLRKGCKGFDEGYVVLSQLSYIEVTLEWYGTPLVVVFN